MTTELFIRRAAKEEADMLTAISFRSKRYWNYPESYYEIWHDELTITAEYIDQHEVYVAELNEEVIGYYSIIHLDRDMEISGIPLARGYWLEHMFVLPAHMGCSIGTGMISHLFKICNLKNISRINVLADPNAREFYTKRGFTFVREYPSTIEGRTTPLLTLSLPADRP